MFTTVEKLTFYHTLHTYEYIRLLPVALGVLAFMLLLA